MIFPDTRYGKFTLFAVLLESVIIIILQSTLAAVFLQYYPNFGGAATFGPHRGIPVYLVIFLLAQVFAIVLCWDALHHKNTIQIIGFVIFNFCSFIYSIFQFVQMKRILEEPLLIPMLDGSRFISGTDASLLRAVLICIPIIFGLCMILFAFFAFKLYLEFGWKIYKKIGADPKMRNMYRSYQIFLMLLKLDAFFIVSFGIQFLVLVISQNDPEFALTICALPILIIILALVVYGVRREDKIIMWLFSLSVLMALAYFVFKLVRIMTTQANQYGDTRNYLLLFSIISLLVVGSTLCVAFVCYRNFGQGLKQYVLKKQPTEINIPDSPTTTRKPIET